MEVQNYMIIIFGFNQVFFTTNSHTPCGSKRYDDLNLFADIDKGHTQYSEELFDSQLWQHWTVSVDVITHFIGSLQLATVYSCFGHK